MRCRRCGTSTSACVKARRLHPQNRFQRNGHSRSYSPQRPLVHASRASAVELASAQQTKLSGATSATFLHRSVNKNETIETQDTLVVMGDCKRGSSVRSKSSIIVLGRLLGDVVAGSSGDESAVVTAGDLQPRRLTIADVTAKPAYWSKNDSIYGQMAYITTEAENPDAVGRATLPEPHAPRGDSLASDVQSTDNCVHERLQRTVKVVPLARPYLSFGPASSQLLREKFEVQLEQSAKSAMITAGYATALGALLMMAPVTVFSVLFDPSTVSTGFIRLGGGLLTLFGLYYWGAVVGCRRGSGVQGFYASTVVGRLLVAILCLGIYFCGEVGPGILFFGAMNGLGAVMMHRAMHADAVHCASI